MDSLKQPYFNRQFTDTKVPDGFVEIMAIHFDGKEVLVALPEFIHNQLPLCEQTVSLICECVRRTLSKTPYGNNA